MFGAKTISVGNKKRRASGFQLPMLENE